MVLVQMFVMAADIRESTTLMKEAVRFERFALVMDKFVSSVRRGIRRSGGWFDKFMGDGFLAYWIVQSASPDEYEVVPPSADGCWHFNDAPGPDTTVLVKLRLASTMTISRLEYVLTVSR